MFQLYHQIDEAKQNIYDKTFFDNVEIIGKKAAGIKAKADELAFLSAVGAFPDIYFCPNGAQERVINAIDEAVKHTKVPTIMCTYANGVGKSLLAAHICDNFVKGPQNGWFDLPVFKQFAFPKKIWYCSKPDIIIRKFIPAIMELLDPLQLKKIVKTTVTEDFTGPIDEIKDDILYTALKEGRQYISEIKLNNGWVIGMKSYNQDPQSYEGDDLGFICNDEPSPENIRSAQKSRRRMGCITLNIFTPLYCPPAVIDEMNEKDEEREQAEKKGEDYRQTHWHLTADVYEACKKRGVRGHLDPEIIDDMVNQYSFEEKEARVYGKPMFFSGRVFQDFDPRIHVRDPEEFPIKPDYLFIQSKDPHDRRLHADGWLAFTPEGRFIVFDELPALKKPHFWEMKMQTTIKTNAKQIKFVEMKWKQRLQRLLNPRRVMDYHFGKQTRGGEGKNFIMKFSEEGLTYSESYKATEEIIFGNNRIRELLQIFPDGEPGLIIHRNCYHSWQGMMHCIYAPESNKDVETKASGSNKILDRYKDFVDMIRYGVCAIMTFPDKNKDKKYMTKRGLL